MPRDCGGGEALPAVPDREKVGHLTWTAHTGLVLMEMGRLSSVGHVEVLKHDQILMPTITGRLLKDL